MSFGSKKIGVIIGLIAAGLCVIAGIYVTTAINDGQVDQGVVVKSVGMVFVALGSFFASIINIISGSTLANQISSVKTENSKSVKSSSTSGASNNNKTRPAPKQEDKKKTEQDNKVAIYAGNLSPEFTEEDVRRAFEPFGTIGTVNVVTDKSTGKCKGFAFVEMPVKTEAIAAIEALNGHELAGRELKVSAARSMPRPRRPRRRSKPADQQ